MKNIEQKTEYAIRLKQANGYAYVTNNFSVTRFPVPTTPLTESQAKGLLRVYNAQSEATVVSRETIVITEDWEPVPTLPASPDLTGKLMRVAPGTEGYTAGRLVKVVKRNGTQKDMWHVVFQDLGTDAYLTTEELVDAPNDYHQKAKFREGDKVVVTGDPGHGRIGTVTSYRFPEKGVPVNVVVKFVDGANGSYDEALLAKHTPPMWKAGDPVRVRHVNDANIPIAGGGRFADVIGYVKLEEGVVRVRFSAGDMGEYHETNLKSRA
jgi:hypothetical protein